MGLAWKSMKRSTLALGAGVLAAVVVAVLVVVLQNRSAPGTPGTAATPETSGSWYPLANEAGDPAVADFATRVPCTIDDPPAPTCQRVKFSVVLYSDEASGEPSTYLISIIRVGVSDARETHEGTWTVGQGTALDARATTYELDDGAPEHLRAYWAIGDDILFLLDEDRMPRVGDTGYGYALSRIPIGQVVTAP